MFPTLFLCCKHRPVVRYALSKGGEARFSPTSCLGSQVIALNSKDLLPAISCTSRYCQHLMEPHLVFFSTSYDGKIGFGYDVSRPRPPRRPPSQPAATPRTKLTSITRAGFLKPRLKGKKMRATTRPTRRPCRGALLSILRATQTAPLTVNTSCRTNVLQEATR